MEDQRDVVTTAIVDKGIRACRNKRQALMVMTVNYTIKRNNLGK